MSAITLRDILISKISKVSYPHDSTVPPLVQLMVSESITEYITSTVKAVGSYSGIIPPSTPESAPVDSWNIIGSMTPCSVPNNLDSWMKDLSNKIRSSFYYGSGISHPLSPTLAFPTVSILPIQKNLYNLAMNNYNNPQPDVILEICVWITQSLSTGFLSTVPAGIAGTGLMTISNIII